MSKIKGLKKGKVSSYNQEFLDKNLGVISETIGEVKSVEYEGVDEFTNNHRFMIKGEKSNVLFQQTEEMVKEFLKDK